MTALLAVAFFFHAEPLDMPGAEAYLVTEPSGERRLEDRYDELDLWTSRAVLGRWSDDTGRMLAVSRLREAAPRFAGGSMTREKYVSNVALIDRKKGDAQRAEAIARLSPFPLPEEPASPRQEIRGMESVLYWHGTNTASLVCSFLPVGAPDWYLAVWDLAEGDEIAVSRDVFEEEFLARWDEIVERDLRSEADTLDPDLVKAAARAERREVRARERALPRRPADRAAAALKRERDLLRADARHSVTNYLDWHVAEAEEFSVLDDLPSNSRAFVTALTNELGVMRAKYAAAVPSPVVTSNVLAVARIYRDRTEYLEALEANDVEGIEWSAAHWSPRRREVVAYLPPDGAGELLKTIRHEAFHQYLSYACSMISASPWLNEGYAQYFEDESSADWGIEVDLEQVAEMLPAVLAMDYDQFYDGSDAARSLKYRVAWSIAYFLEKGAPKVRFDPFKDLKRKYVDALLKNHDMRAATAVAFGTRDDLKLFVSEWKKFWKNM